MSVFLSGGKTSKCRLYTRLKQALIGNEVLHRVFRNHNFVFQTQSMPNETCVTTLSLSARAEDLEPDLKIIFPSMVALLARWRPTSMIRPQSFQLKHVATYVKTKNSPWPDSRTWRLQRAVKATFAPSRFTQVKLIFSRQTSVGSRLSILLKAWHKRTVV